MKIMGCSDRTVRLTAVLVLLCVAFCMSAGCIGVANPTPNQAMVRENLIFMDPDYVDAEFIWSLLLSPNAYDAELVAAVDKYMPIENPVIELGAGVGVLSTYVNDRLILPVNQISVEPNPYLQPSLSQTRDANMAGFTIVPKAVAYGSQNVTFAVGSNIVKNRITDNSIFVETVTVPTTTVQQLASDARFSNNITLIMNIVGYEHDVGQREPEFLKNNVSTIISAVYTVGKNTPDTFSERMKYLGFTEMSRANDEVGGYTAMTFQKL
ncbi:hypothetical protein McpSp1_16430 [Methanocorpusculaceae archaeon Sp1]|uniref:Uncharacterized protein n=1 Tax=Methanorbis furvi TaxID=3028299 RepID=A0AAE4S9C1_9EURY|nr:hypothetical protein [Methanocorpusculaceae archaeon Sp1]MDV0441632.1 hypothetical protein [Methanocorpusculaceae archaeon Ag1]